jgi:hypothetical protein
MFVAAIFLGGSADGGRDEKILKLKLFTTN